MNKLLLVIVMAALSRPVFALDANEAFAGRLFDKGEYRWALVEYERLLFTFPDSSAAGYWNYRTGLCNLNENRQQNAIAEFKKAFTDSAIADSARLRAAECALRLHAPDSALSFVSPCKFSLGKVYEGYADFCDADYPAALARLRLVNDSSVASFKARSLEKIIADASSSSKKHYVPAALLAIVPGLGHVYTRRYGDGAMTALTVATGAFVTGYYAWHNARPQAWTIGTITGLFYAGGIYGSIVAVKIYNKETAGNITLRAERVVLGQ